MIVRPLKPGRTGLLAAIVGTLAACTSVPLPPPQKPAPVVTPTPSPPPAVPGPGRTGPIPGALQRTKSQWAPARWEDLPGWDTDRIREWWPALHRSCLKPVNGWAGLCTEVRRLGAAWGGQVDDGFVRQWVQGHLQPWRVVGLDGVSDRGLLTGYFEPMLEGRRRPEGRFQHPVHRPPADLAQRRPHLSRTALETTAEGRAALAGRELVWLADPLDVLLVQVQGSGRVRVLDEPDAQGRPRVVRLAFGGHNDQPYQSVARWLVDQGAFPLEQASWPAIRQWAAQNPTRVGEMLRANPRVVFFKEEPLPDPEVGPVGAQGVPLTPGRSIAVDRDSIPLGTPVWVDSTVPQPWSATPSAQPPLRRLVMAQDTGGAILGAVRADFFWGWGDEALALAGRTKQPVALWVLWPRTP
ncbi:murein transglycosylase A [Aquabacterium olei]|nr:MltA domain-containing protein [Aquabacterium olei]